MQWLPSRIDDDAAILAADAVISVDVGEEALDRAGYAVAAPKSERRFDNATDRAAIVGEIGVVLTVEGAGIALAGEADIGKRQQLTAAADRDHGGAGGRGHDLLRCGALGEGGKPQSGSRQQPQWFTHEESPHLICDGG
jgi:hypothetical protein